MLPHINTSEDLFKHSHSWNYLSNVCLMTLLDGIIGLTKACRIKYSNMQFANIFWCRRIRVCFCVAYIMFVYLTTIVQWWHCVTKYWFYCDRLMYIVHVQGWRGVPFRLTIGLVELRAMTNNNNTENWQRQTFVKFPTSC